MPVVRSHFGALLMSTQARRLLQLRYWLEAMEALPPGAFRDREIFVTEPKLRGWAQYVIECGTAA